MENDTIQEYDKFIKDSRDKMIDFLSSSRKESLYDDIAKRKLSDSEISSAIGVSLFCYIYCCATFDELKKHEEIVTSLREKQICSNSLLDLAIGAKTESETIYYDKDGEITRSKKTIIKNPPSINAITFLLQNKDISDRNTDNVKIYIPEFDNED